MRVGAEWGICFLAIAVCLVLGACGAPLSNPAPLDEQAAMPEVQRGGDSGGGSGM